MTDHLPRLVEVRPRWCTYEVKSGGVTELVSASSPEHAERKAEGQADRLNWRTTYGDRRLWPLFGCIDMDTGHD